jgi:hypothetical protein
MSQYCARCGEFFSVENYRTTYKKKDYCQKCLKIIKESEPAEFCARCKEPFLLNSDHIKIGGEEYCEKCASIINKGKETKNISDEGANQEIELPPNERFQQIVLEKLNSINTASNEAAQSLKTIKNIIIVIIILSIVGVILRACGL